MTRWLLAWVGISIAMLVTKAASAADACFDDRATSSVLSCAGVRGSVDTSRARAGVDLHGVQQPGAKKPSAAPPPTPPVNDVPRDERKLRLQARQRRLLVVEAAQVESLFGTTRTNAPDRLQIARRLADVYVELESAAFRDKVEAETKRDALKKKGDAAAGQQQTEANAADRDMKAARRRAIDLYTLIRKDYPTHAQVDEVLYYLAYEHEQAGDAKSARSVYYDLIQTAPQSKYIPSAYLAFGELFFTEAQGDPSKWDLAAKAYSEVVKYPAPGNKVLGYAWYKTAYVFWNKGELDKSLHAFKKTIEFGVANTQLPGAAKLAESARRDVVAVYALKGDPVQAYNFFHGLSGDPSSSSDRTYRMMDDLGVHYIDTGHYPEAILLFKDLVARDRSGRVCGYQAHITEATMALRSGNKEAILAELDNQLRVESAMKASGEGKEQQQECSSRSAALVAETAMAWHLEAVGSPAQRGTNDKKTMALAAQLYKRTVDAWTAKEFESFVFPRLVKADWPTISKIKYAMADLLFEEKAWSKCGPAFDMVVDDNPAGPDAASAAYAAGLCYQHAWEEAHASDHGRRGGGNLPGQHANESASLAQTLKPKEMKPEQRAMAKALHRYTCLVKPAANDAAGQAELVEVEYALARTYFEAQHWEEAGALFRAIALEHPTHEAAIYAAHLYLESANVLLGHFGKTACESEMAADVPRFSESFCTTERSKNADACSTLKVVQINLLRLHAERLVAQADRETGPQATFHYEQGGQAYFDLFKRYCQDPLHAGGKPEAEKCDEIAYNAARAFQAARLLAKAIVVRRALLAFDEQTRMRSPLAKKASYEIGGNYQAIAVYEQAAEWYERYARSDARAENADRALSDAVLLRLGLGQEQEAVKDAQDFQRSYGASRPAETAAIAFAIGAHYAEKNDWEKAKSALVGSMSVLDRAALDVQVQAHATLGRALSKLNQAPAAIAEFSKVRSLWSDGSTADAKLRVAYPAEDDSQRARRMGRALSAAGEAFFEGAEQRRVAEVEPLKFPEYKGAGDKASVKMHVDTKVRDWYSKKMAAIQKVEPAYEKLLDLKPTAPPRWVIAAGARDGQMWGDFVDDFRRAPIPKAWRGTDLEQVYTSAIHDASEPYKTAHAKPAMTKCLELSTRYQYFDDFSRSCELWLAKKYPHEYHVIDELRGAPALTNSGLDEKAPPVLVSGAFHHAAATPDRPNDGAPRAPAPPSRRRSN